MQRPACAPGCSIRSNHQPWLIKLKGVREDGNGTWQGGNLLEKGTSGGRQLLTMHLGLGYPDGEAEALLVRRQNPAQPKLSLAQLCSSQGQQTLPLCCVLCQNHVSKG